MTNNTYTQKLDTLQKIQEIIDESKYNLILLSNADEIARKKQFIKNCSNYIFNLSMRISSNSKSLNKKLNQERIKLLDELETYLGHRIRFADLQKEFPKLSDIDFDLLLEDF